ncbi:MAG: hypothetical protein ABWY20_18195 [Mycobacterium sp.]
MVGVDGWLGVPQLMAVRVLDPGTPGVPRRMVTVPVVSSPTPSTLASQTAPDYSRLSTHRTPATSTPPGDKFVTRSSTTNPGGIDGVAVLFVNQDDTRAIGDTILVCAMARYTKMYAIHQNVDASDDSACWPTRCDHAG